MWANLQGTELKEPGLVLAAYGAHNIELMSKIID